MLPAIKKTVIYLDQFVISDMMKSINTAYPNHKDKRLKPFRQLYEKIDRLCKLQLIICPYSENHRIESMASAFHKEFRRIYQHLSHGIAFAPSDEIKKRELLRSVQEWLGLDFDTVEIDDVTNGFVHGWQSRQLITANIGFNQQIVHNEAASRKKWSQILHDLFRNWQLQKQTTFDQVYQHEIEESGLTILRFCNGNYPNLTRDVELVSKEILCSKTDELSEVELASKIREFFLSRNYQSIPHIQITCMMYAALAREAITGRTNLPTVGMNADVGAISLYTPYCDAIFVDKECRNLLCKVPQNSKAGQAKKQLRLMDKVFSMSNLDEFMAYLDGIEEEATPEHLALVKEVYGEGWEEPYTTIFQNEKF